MGQLEILLGEQEVDCYAINRILPNLKKLGQAKLTVPVLDQRIERVKELLAAITKRHAVLTTAATDKEIEQLSYFAEDKLEATMTTADETLDFLVTTRVSLSPTAASVGSINFPPSLPSDKPSVPLLKIELPKFDGSLIQWESFRNRFVSLIIEDSRITDHERMHYLLASVTGEALEAINQLPVVAESFAVAWKELKDQFENERWLITEHLRKLFSVPIVESNSFHGINRLRATVKSVMHALKTLKRPVEHWDDIIVYLVSTKLDDKSISDWESVLRNTKKYPTYAEFDSFLDGRSQMLKSLAANKGQHESESDTKQSTELPPKRPNDLAARRSNTSAKVSLAITASKFSCFVCKKGHPLYQCAAFLSYSVNKRRQCLTDQGRCFNCFCSSHKSPTCPNKHRCRHCNGRHHTLIHRDTTASPTVESQSVAQPAPTSTSTPATSSGVALMALSELMNDSAMLATARVRVYSPQGHSACVRAVLDQGSQVTVISDKLANLLRLPRSKVHFDLGGVGRCREIARQAAMISIGSVSGDAVTPSTAAIILPSLTTYSTRCLSVDLNLPHLKNLDLADQDLSGSDPFDILIGVKLYSALLRDGLRVGKPNEPIAQNTIFGWVVSGALPSWTSHSSSAHLHHGTLHQLGFALQRFWEIENVASKLPLTPTEQQCEDQFAATHSRSADGRYTVRLPFNSESPIQLGDSRPSALASLCRLEKRLKLDKSKAADYAEFLAEYEKLGHMSEVSDRDATPYPPHYIPHHAVFRDDSTTTRLRVVFNASNKTSNGRSLNDYLLPGPKLQTDLTSLILRWRQYRYVLTADIAKMYRQIRIDPRDADYQRILWRPSPSAQVKEYRLLTVTYGTASAPFLALRVLRQLVHDEGSQYPLAVPVVIDQTYVDDCIFGADNHEIALKTRDELISLMQKGGLHLRKWSSNHSTLLADIDVSDCCPALRKDLDDSKTLKILGISWHPHQDVFRYRINSAPLSQITKRTVLSTIATIFDPLGWITPVTITSKIVLQQLWVLSCDWDDPLPTPIRDEWSTFHSQLPLLESIEIPRWTARCANSHLELHGFSDASSKAYAAAVYLRVRSPSGKISTTLLIGKSKVAPLKTITIPRLELSAAWLLAQLISSTRDALNLQSVPYHCWTDSTVVLHWLRQPPATWQTFVANRVSQIQDLTGGAAWHHVPTEDNPADCASRGLCPRDLQSHPLWWSGPSWLGQSSEHWPQSLPTDTGNVDLETRVATVMHTVHPPALWDLQSRYSSWPRLIRVTAIVLRFVRHARRKSSSSAPSRPPDSMNKPAIISTTDITNARNFWLHQIQAEVFPAEIAALNAGNRLPKSSPLIPLCPYIDNNGLIRVQGRLRHAPWSESAKHPIILSDHPLVRLLISSTHLQLLHAGSILTLAHLRRLYWIVRARPLIRSILYRCIQCTRQKAKSPEVFMGDLPSSRVTANARAFLHTGVDYAGPILIRNASGRGHKAHKAYIAVFVCMATKAIHIELVSDYTTPAFIAAFQRFASRRGFPQAMYSDNGTTFRGADRELSSSYRAAIRDPNFATSLITEGVTWHFIPPAAPHFGGLWEVSVRCVKTHLTRCIGSHTLTYEEMTTFLCRVEACLNSRPIAACSENFDDYQTLTPGHFLIQTPLLSIPEPSILELRETRLSRWQLIQRLHEQFWTAWHRDYLNSLQQRPKWRTRHRLTTVGQLVLLRDSGLPPSRWALGRIVACHPGDDGIVRVVTIKTSNAIYKRPVTKICFLPVHIHQAEQSDSCTAGGDTCETPSSTN